MDYPRAFVSFPRIAGSGNEIALTVALVQAVEPTHPHCKNTYYRYMSNAPRIPIIGTFMCSATFV
jgi:hypothetical protein